MIPVFYIIVLQALICGFMLCRTLNSKTKHIWHMPVYILIKAIVCTYFVYRNLGIFVTPLCILFSFVYALIFFRDSFLRKISVVSCGVLCLATSNLIKYFLLDSMALTQDFQTTPDLLLTNSVLSFSILFFCLFTIICTNLLCRVRFVILGGITLVHLLLLSLTALLYAYVYNLISANFNHLYSVFALYLLLPAVVMLYFSESIIFTRKDNYFKVSQQSQQKV